MILRQVHLQKPNKNFTSAKGYSSVAFPPARQCELPGKPVEDLTKTLNR
jgi:hypothetical protein